MKPDHAQLVAEWERVEAIVVEARGMLRIGSLEYWRSGQGPTRAERTGADGAYWKAPHIGTPRAPRRARRRDKKRKNKS